MQSTWKLRNITGEYLTTRWEREKALFGCKIFKRAHYCISITSKILLWSFMLIKKRKQTNHACSTKCASSLSWQGLGILVIDSWENFHDWQDPAMPSRGIIYMLTLKIMPASLSYFFFQNLLLVNFSRCFTWAIKHFIGLLSQKGENNVVVKVQASTLAPQELNHSDMSESQVRFPRWRKLKRLSLIPYFWKVQNALTLPRNCSSLLSSVFPDLRWVFDMVGVQEKEDVKHFSNPNSFSK